MNRWNYGTGSILAAASSIRRYYGLKTYSPTSPLLDRWLNEYSFRCVIVILADAMGSFILPKHLSSESFLRRHVCMDMETVFPTATTAATTALRTGQPPSRTGWIGWSQYFSEKNDLVIPFLSKGMYSSRQYEPHLAEKLLKTEYTVDQLNQAGIHAENVWPSFGETNPCRDYHEVAETTLRLSEKKDIRFIYAYWDLLDTLMHRNGTDHVLVKEELETINQYTESLAERMPGDCGLIVMADHGQVDTDTIDLRKYPELLDCLIHAPMLEARMTAFAVKEEKKEAFETRFLKCFGKEFALVKSDEMLRQGWFGDACGPAFRKEFIGDYVSYALAAWRFGMNDAQLNTKGDHGSILKQERTVPLILYPDPVHGI